MAFDPVTLGAAVQLAKDPATIKASVEDWLDDHPEATTTVEDGSITKAKLHDDLADEIEQNTADVGVLKSAFDYQTGKNRFNGNFTDGYYVNQLNGTLGESSSKSATDYIEVESQFVLSLAPFAQIQLAIYDASKRYLTGFKYDAISDMDSDLTIGVKYKAYNITGAKYVRFSIGTTNIPLMTVIQVENGTVPTSYVPYSDKYVLKEESLPDGYEGMPEKINSLGTFTNNFTPIPQSAITVTNGYFKNTNGSDDGPFDNWYYVTTNATPGSTYKIASHTGLNARLWLFLDSSGNVISYSSDNSAVSNKTETVVAPENASKLVVNVNTGGSYNISVLDGIKWIPNLPDIYKENILYGKTLVCCGDSITYGADMDAEGITNTSDITVYQSNNTGDFSEVTSGFLKSWGYQIAERNNMLFYNGGVSGSTMQDIAHHYGFSAENGRYTKLPESIDYLLLWFGWNDNAYGTLGTINDTTNESYYGGYNVVLPYLIDKYPYTKIGLIVPFGSSAGHREAIRLLGNKWGLAVWDNYLGGTPLYFAKEDSVGLQASIATSNRAKFQANGAHPNYKGHRQLADMIEKWMRGI